MPKIISIILILLILSLGCSDTKPFLRKTRTGEPVQVGDPNQRPDHAEVVTFYALGDWGTGDRNQKAVAASLKANVACISAGRVHAPFVLGLGDNVYEIGLPEGWGNPKTEKMLRETFGNIYKEVKYEGKELVYHIIPGNHDYNGVAGGINGWGDVIHQETTAEKLYAPYWKYYPIEPGKNSDTNDATNYQALKSENILSLAIPEKVSLLTDRRLIVIALDTQVLLNLYKKNDLNILQKHWQRFEELLNEDAAWKIIIGHHPLRTHGRHGGFRSAVWWLPVPPIFLYTVVDKLFIKPLQDLDNSANKRFQRDLMRLIKKHGVNVYLSGHEHSLQFLQMEGKHFQIISGSAAKLSGVTHKKDTIFSHAARGFVRFDLTSEELWVEFFQTTAKKIKYESTALFRIRK